MLLRIDYPSLNSRGSDCPHRLANEVVRIATGVLLSSALASIAAAQGQGGSGRSGQGVVISGMVITTGSGSGTSNMVISGGPGGMVRDTTGVEVTPGSVVIDPKTRSATLEIVNHGADTAHAKVAVQDDPPGSKNFDAQVAALQQSLQKQGNTANAQGKQGDQKTDKSGGKDAKAKQWSLAPWVQGLPTEVTLAPHEKRAVTVHLAVPSGAAAGNYSGYVLVTTSSSAKGQPAVTQSDDQPQSGGGQTMVMTLGGSGGGQGVTMNVNGQQMTMVMSPAGSGGSDDNAQGGAPTVQVLKKSVSSAKLVYHVK